MESVLSAKIASAVAGFSHLKQVIVSYPTTVQRFPHLSSIHCLQLLSIPPDCDDWQWLQDVKSLTELHVIVRGTKGDSGSILIRTNIAEVKSPADTKTVSMLGNILSHLPFTLMKMDASITESKTRLSVEGHQAALTHVSDTEIIAALAKILFSIRREPPKLAVSISDHGGRNYGCLNISGEKADLHCSAKNRTIVLGALLKNIPPFITRLDVLVTGEGSNRGHFIVNGEKAVLSSLADTKITGALTTLLSNVHAKITELGAIITGKETNVGNLIANADKAELTSVADHETVASLAIILSNLPMRLSKLDATISGSGSTLGHLTVDANKAELRSVPDTKSVKALAIILSHLPITLSKLDASISGSGSTPGHLTVDANKAELRSVPDTKSVKALAIILSHLPITLSKLDASILGNGSTPSHLIVNANKAELACVADTETVAALANIVSHLPMDISELDASITSGGENVRCFTVNGDEAKLTKISEEKGSQLIVKVVGSLPECIREKVITRSLFLCLFFLSFFYRPNVFFCFLYGLFN